MPNSMASSLESLPIEVVEHVATKLDLHSISSLRMTSRNIKSKVSQGCFARYFHTKDIKLSLNTLQNMVWITSQDHLGGLLRHCTITGIAKIDMDMDTQSGANEYIQLLTKAFLNLKQRSQNRGLVSLCLRVTTTPPTSGEDIIEPIPWRCIWATALNTFNITMAALKESHLLVDDHLDIFGSLKGCSLGYDTFLPPSHNLSSTRVFTSLKNLTLSLSSSHTEFEEQSPGKTDDIPTPYLFRGIIKMLETMPQLESLDLHWYHLTWNVSTQSENYLDIGSPSTFAGLKELTLRGIRASEGNLLEFIKVLRPEKLTMKDVKLVSGTYTSFFDYLTSSDTPVTHYCLDDIFQNTHSLVHFDIPGYPKFPYYGNIRMGPSTLIRDKDHAKEAIRYRIPSKRALGSPQNHIWYRSKNIEYGPPGYHGNYDFVELNT